MAVTQLIKYLLSAKHAQFVAIPLCRTKQFLRRFIRHAVCEVTLFQERNRTDCPETQAGMLLPCLRVCPIVRVLPPFCAVSLSAFLYQCINQAPRYHK